MHCLLPISEPHPAASPCFSPRSPQARQSKVLRDWTHEWLGRGSSGRERHDTNRFALINAGQRQMLHMRLLQQSALVNMMPSKPCRKPTCASNLYPLGFMMCFGFHLNKYIFIWELSRKAELLLPDLRSMKLLFLPKNWPTHQCIQVSPSCIGSWSQAA